MKSRVRETSPLAESDEDDVQLTRFSTHHQAMLSKLAKDHGAKTKKRANLEKLATTVGDILKEQGSAPPSR